MHMSYLLWGIGIPLCLMIMTIYLRVGGVLCGLVVVAGGWCKVHACCCCGGGEGGARVARLQAGMRTLHVAAPASMP